MPLPQAYFFQPYDSKFLMAMRSGLRAPHPQQGSFAVTEPSLAGTTAKPGSALPPVPEDNGHQASSRQASTPCTSTTTGKALPSLAGNSTSTGDDGGSFECSSAAPYWIPDDIRHYFVHRHSLAGMGGGADSSSSRHTDWALREIGRERELPTDEGNSWSRWTTECFGTGKNAVVAWVATATALILLLVLVGMVADLPRSDEGVPAAARYRREDSAGNHRSDFRPPLPKDDIDTDYSEQNNGDSTTVRLEEGESDPDNVVGTDERRDASATGPGVMPDKGNAASATDNVVEKPDEPGRSSLRTSVRTHFA
ncbi:hypothetical protein MTO96_035351 [Rhipicephalus appendiculatus]